MRNEIPACATAQHAHASAIDRVTAPEIAEHDQEGPTPHMRYGYVHPTVAQFPHEVLA